MKIQSKYQSLEHHFQTFDFLDDGYLIFDNEQREIIYQNNVLVEIIGDWGKKTLLDLGNEIKDSDTGRKLCDYTLNNENPSVKFQLSVKDRVFSVTKLPQWRQYNLTLLKWSDVTSVDAVNKELMDQRLQLSALVKSSDDIIFEIDDQGFFTHYWAREPDTLFIPSDKIIGYNVTDAFPGEFGQRVREIIESVYKEKVDKSFTYKDPTGRTKSHYRADLKYVIHPNNSPSLIVHIRETELNSDLKNKLQETSRLLDNLFKIPGGPVVYVQELFGEKPIFCSPNALALTGYPVDNGVFSEEWIDIIAPPDKEPISLILNDFLDSENEEISLEYRIVTKKGEIKWVKEYITKELNPQSKNPQIQGTLVDITHLKATSKAFEESVMRFNKAFENAPLGMALISPENQWLQINKTLQDFFGYTPNELLNKTILSISHPEDLKDEEAELEKMHLGKLERTDSEKRFVRSDGSIVWGHQFVSCVRNSTGKIIYFIYQIQDISELRKKEEALIQAREQAEKASKAKTDFLSQMSHEIRTPLNSVVGISNILLEDFSDDERLTEPLSILKSGSASLLSIVNNILDLNKIEEGKLKLETIKFNLKENAETTLNTYLQRIEEKELTVRLRYHSELPKTFSGDPFRINQILHNLISNAIKYTKEGGIEIEFTGKHLSPNKWMIKLAVSDTGVGISTKVQPRIFNPFEQGSKNRARKYGGSGLGLSIVKTLAVLMGGDVGLVSKVGIGSTFSVELPLTSHTEKKEKNTSVKNKPQGALEGKSILLVEDNPMNIHISRRYLEKWKTVFQIAETGESAIKMAKATEFDLILMDIQLPGVNGLGAMKRIRENGSNSPCLLLTATTNFEKPSYYDEIKVHDVVFKPFLPDDLFDKMIAAISAHKHP